MTNIHKIIKIKNDNFITKFRFIDSNRNIKILTVDKINFGWFDTPFGIALIMKNESGLCGLAFTSEFGQKFALHDMKKGGQIQAFLKTLKQSKNIIKLLSQAQVNCVCI